MPEYRQTLELLPRATEARIPLAKAYARLGRLDAAEAQCREVLRIHAANAQARATLDHVRALRSRGR